MTGEPHTTCRVLLVEDEDIIAMLMEDMLAEFDCEVSMLVGQVDEAVRVAKTDSFDLAFIDVNLRGTPAWPVAEALADRGIPFAFVTGYGSAGVGGTQWDVPVLQKPFRVQQLGAIIERLRRQAPAENG